jgi:hypothetical protein
MAVCADDHLETETEPRRSLRLSESFEKSPVTHLAGWHLEIRMA